MLRLGLQGAPLFLLTCPGMTEWAVLPTRVCVCVCVCVREREATKIRTLSFLLGFLHRKRVYDEDDHQTERKLLSIFSSAFAFDTA